jgi:hypothetical protein
VEVKIGVQNVARELMIDTDMSGDDVEARVAKALSDSDGVLTLTDTKGRRVVVPVGKLAYVEVGAPSVGQVGFRS